MSNYIKCPRCGYEYHPSEIFIPNCFFGKPTYILRNIEGKITNVTGKESDYTELYKCDNCNTSFNITTNIDFITKIDAPSDFDYDYETKIDK